MIDAIAPKPAAVVPLDKPLYGASFAQAVVRQFRKYAEFSGRASRSEFWWATLFYFVVPLMFLVPGLLIGYATGYEQISQVTGKLTTVPGPAWLVCLSLAVLFYLGILLPSIAVAVRRLHDANFSGAFYLLVFLGGLGSAALLVLAALESKPEGSRFDAQEQVWTAPNLPADGTPPPVPLAPTTSDPSNP